MNFQVTEINYEMNLTTMIHKLYQTYYTVIFLF